MKVLISIVKILFRIGQQQLIVPKVNLSNQESEKKQFVGWTAPPNQTKAQNIAKIRTFLLYLQQNSEEIVRDRLFRISVNPSFDP